MLFYSCYLMNVFLLLLFEKPYSIGFLMADSHCDNLAHIMGQHILYFVTKGCVSWTETLEILQPWNTHWKCDSYSW